MDIQQSVRIKWRCRTLIEITNTIGYTTTWCLMDIRQTVPYKFESTVPYVHFYNIFQNFTKTIIGINFILIQHSLFNINALMWHLCLKFDCTEYLLFGVQSCETLTSFFSEFTKVDIRHDNPQATISISART